MCSVVCKDAQREEVFKDLNLSVYESKELVTALSHRVQWARRNDLSQVGHRLPLRTRSIHDKILELKTLRPDADS